MTLTVRGSPVTLAVVAALVPLLLAGLVTQAWRNSQALAVMQAELVHVQADMARCK